ncbi:hypothetical protein Klosneuvirus_3_160 [Klosneuvirus KNV1]|uniref:Uncharacterized protein n=1 Tax=Klosneuvirus KNV1 TaxID=1977640 RepID=A0A1V0SJW4_9VIRU|nr:hypothetical protein Klosneuvirus_3_160 [Klosneuvirus KNV1]
MASTPIGIFICLITGFYLYTLTDIVHNVQPKFPDPNVFKTTEPDQIKLWTDVKYLSNLVNQHNKYELEHGFVPPDKINQTKTKCHVPNNKTILKQWWMMNTFLKYYCESGQYRYLENDACSNNDTTVCTIVKSCVGKEYDSLYIASNFCYLAYPRADPSLKILNYGKEQWNNDTQKLERVLKVEVALPNGTKIPANDSRVMVLSYGDDFYGYNFKVLSGSDILFQYSNQSGYTPVHEELVDPTCTHLGGQRTWIYEKRRCGITMTWNWNNSIVNDTNVSWWMVRHPYYHNYWNHEFIEIVFDELDR